MTLLNIKKCIYSTLKKRKKNQYVFSLAQPVWPHIRM